jgi:hypothetical protein
MELPEGDRRNSFYAVTEFCEVKRAGAEVTPAQE